MKKNKNLIGVKLLVSLLVSILYFWVITTLVKKAYSNSYYHLPTVSLVLTVINCGVIIILFITVNKISLLKICRRKVTISIITFLLILIYALPLCFSKQGMVADKYSIIKVDILGNTVKELNYQDIELIDVSVRDGIQYDIKFKNGESVFVYSHTIINTFKSDYAILEFDKAISKYANKILTNDSGITPSNTRRFFKNKEVFEYFDDFFSIYYNKKDRETGDGSVC